MNTLLFFKKNRSFTPLNAALRQFRQKRNYLTGFTLIELLVVISIFGLISSVIIVSTQSARDQARIASALTFSATLKHSLGDSLVGEWRFEEGSDDTCGTPPYNDFCDTSNNGNHGRKIGNPSRVPNEISQLGKAGLFSGGIDRIEIADSDNLDLTSEITIEGWMKPEVGFAGSSKVLVNKVGVYSLYIDTSSQPRLTLIGVGNLFCPAFDFSGKWHHFVGTYNGSKQQIFVDGKENCSQPASGSMSQTNLPLLIAPFLNGNIDEVRIYSRGLTQAEIQKHYVEGAKKRGLLVQE